MFDIYEQAKEIPHADYMDMKTGRIYKIAQYTEELKTNPDARILVTDLSGDPIGYAKRIDNT